MQPPKIIPAHCHPPRFPPWFSPLKPSHKGIRSTTSKQPRLSTPAVIIQTPIMPHLHWPVEDDVDYKSNTAPCFNIIDNNNDHSITNVFCFWAFANKITGIIYNDCTDEFPYMLLDGNVCFLIMYHEKTNAIFATPIPCLHSLSILGTNRKIFEYLIKKGYKPILNVMGSQVTKVINLAGCKPPTCVTS